MLISHDIVIIMKATDWWTLYNLNWGVVVDLKDFWALLDASSMTERPDRLNSPIKARSALLQEITAIGWFKAAKCARSVD
ncbi:hypothetical protein PDE_04435 [Penicillium oxalicum 114-2]|uniref:Uncharacterized protein n=1 Tax=Penicillium oxalicum (strain 114-2 / CGMCC 5302) TaxID=933388 RepID=S7ZFN2_PENO1|nr:hypothetical protein PDE_04435 [Penicillium oxalicum 114-2]